METRGRALYNLIRMKWQEDSSLAVEPWQVEDLHTLPEESLFKRLEDLDIILDEARFVEYASSASSPEDLTETLWVEEDFQRFDQAYLLIFELWRRLLPEKQSLSIFCDQLDFLIDQYDRGEFEQEEQFHNALAELERILDEHADQGEDPHQLFDEISLYCAHDLESFIYDFASDEIDHSHPLHASELIDGFLPYIHDTAWFEFLQLRLLALSDEEEARAMLERILEQQKQEPNFELLLEIARFLVNCGAISHFVETIKQAQNLIQLEQDLQEILAISCEFYRLLDREEESNQIGKLLKDRQGNPLEQKISPSDPTLKQYCELLDT